MTWPTHEDPGAFGSIEPPPGTGEARFAVLPLPYGGTATWQKGTERGPEAILAASAHMELYDIGTDCEPWREGILTMAPAGGFESPQAMVTGVRKAATDLIDRGMTVVGLGGEHSVSIGLIQAHAERYPDLCVLQIDAHADTRDEYEGSRYNHACVMARVAEVCDYVQVGIRSMDASERGHLRGDRVFFPWDLEEDETGTRDSVLRSLGNPVYVTIDLDALDPAEMPSTGTPEPGGLRYRQLVRLLAEVCEKRRVVGFDVVELMPRPENKAPDFLAARLTYQMMALLVKG